MATEMTDWRPVSLESNSLTLRDESHPRISASLEPRDDKKPVSEFRKLELSIPLDCFGVCFGEKLERS